MGANGGNIRFGVDFNVNKSGLNQLKASLQEIQKLTVESVVNLDDKLDMTKAVNSLNQVKATAKEVEQALNRSFNQKLGTVNVTKFNQELSKLGLKEIYNQFSSIGTVGQQAFRNMTTQILTTNMQLKQSHKLLDEMATTMANTVKWGVASSIMNNFTGSVQKAYGYVKSLDSSLNDIRIVTGYSADEMDRFAVQVNKAAKALGQSTTDYTEAALIYYQQGLSDEEVAARAETTLKAANVTGQSGQEVSEQLTAVWNGYKVSAEEAELYIDKLAAVAATTASDLEELSTGMSKVASAADLMGVDIDQLNAQLATIVSVTRQAPESVGTALKTIYARMGDIKAGLDGEVSLDEYTSQMAEMGVNVLDASGNLRDMGTVIEEIGEKWTSMSREQQISLSQTMAGTRQYNNLLSLFDNWDMYTDALETSTNAAGTLQKQQDIYMESTAAHLQQLTAATEDVYDSLFNAESFNNVLDILTGSVDLFGNFIDGIGGGGTALLGLGSIATKVFSKQISGGIATAIKNFRNMKYNAEQVQSSFELLGKFKNVINEATDVEQATRDIVEFESKIMDLTSVISPEQFNELQQYIQKMNEAANAVSEFKKKQAELGTTALQLSTPGMEEGLSEEFWNKLNAFQSNKKLTFEEISTQFGDLTEFKALNETIDNLNTTFSLTKKSIQEIRKEQKNLTSEGKEYGNALKNLLEPIDKDGKGFWTAFDTTMANEALGDFSSKMLTAKQTFQSLGENASAEEYQAAFNELARLLNQATELLQQKVNNVKQAVVDSANGMQKELEETFGAVKKVASEGLDDFQLQVKADGIIKTIAAVEDLSFALSSLGNIDDILSDETLTGFEKFTQIISALASGSLMLASALYVLGPNLINLGISMGALTKGASLLGATITGTSITIGAAIPWIVGIGVAIAGVAKVLDYFIVTEEEANEALKSSISGYQEIETELDSLESKLKDVNEQLTELYNKDELTLTDEQEIARLEAESRELENQVALQKQLAELKQQEIIHSAEDAYKAGSYDFDSKLYAKESYNTFIPEVDVTNAKNYDNWVAERKAQIIKMEAEGRNTKEIEEALNEAERLRTESLSSLSESYSDNNEALKALLENPEGNEDVIQALQNWFARYHEAIGDMDDIAANAFENTDIQDLEGTQANLKESNLGADGEWSEEDLKAEGISDESIKTLKESADAANISLTELVNSFINLEHASRSSGEYASEVLKGIASEQGLELTPEQLDIFTNQVNTMLEMGIDPDIILQAINSVDWSQIDLSNPKEAFSALNLEIRQTAFASQEAKEEAELMRETLKEIESLELDSEEVLAYADNLQKMAKESDKISDSLEDNDKAAKKIAISNSRLNKGLNDLNDNWEDYADILKKGEKESVEYSNAMENVGSILEDVLDIDDFGVLSDDFIAKNLEDIEAAANGSTDAVQRLREAAAQDIAINLDLPETEKALITEELSNFIANTDFENLEIGASLDDTGFIDALNTLILASEDGVSQAQGILDTLGYTPEISYEPVTVTNQDEKTGMSTVEYVDPNTGDVVTKTVKSSLLINDAGTMMLPIINGSHVQYTGAPGVSASSPKRSGKGGGGGGGGGGSSKPKTEKPLESKKDRYHDVNVQLEQIDEELEDIGRDQEKLFGKDLLNSLNKELKVLEKQRDVLQDKLDIARQEQKELQDTLSAEGVQFNQDGTIANYLSIMQQKEDEINALISQYNAMSAEEQEAFKESTLDPAMEAYEEFVENLENYDDVILETIPEIENAIQDVADREVEINIQKLNMEIELRLDLSEAQKDWDEFKRKVIDDIDDDDTYKNAIADADLYETLLSNGTTEAGTNTLNTTIAEIQKMNNGESSSIYGNDKQAALEDLENQMDGLMGHLEDLVDLQDQIHESYLDMIDKTGEAFDEQVESYEYVGDLLEHNMNLIQLINGEDAYSDLANLYEAQEKNNLATIAAQKSSVDYYRSMMETETDSEALEKWTELWKDAVADLNSTVEASVENIINKYANSINIIFDELDNKLTNGKGLDYLTQEWELQNENAEMYLDTINSAYEIQSLERKVQDSINNTDSLSAQKKLNDFMDEELKKLREKEKITQYDVDRANALYEIKLKEIALEEAQQNKSKMRLRRDASGNYSYQFVADQDSISAAQQELDDAKNSLYNMDKDKYKENQQAILDAYTEYQEKMRDAANLSAEERALIEEEYNEKINFLLDENEDVRINLMDSAFSEQAALYGSDVANFQQMSADEQQILMDTIVPTWDSGIQAMIEKMTGEGGFGPACKDAMEQLNTETQKYKNSLAEIETTAGISFGALSTGTNENIELAEDLANKMADVVTETQNETIAVGELKTQVDLLAQAYKTVFDNATNALTAAQNLAEYEKKKAAEAAAEEEARRKAEEEAANGGTAVDDSDSGGSSGSGGSGGSSTGETPDNTNLAEGVAASIWLHGSNSSGWGKGAIRAQRFNEKGVAYAQKLLNDAELRGDPTLYKNWIGKQDELKKYYYKAFDTGGYTGEWGDEGKLAVLHEKELVLNKDDTKNILSAMMIARSMESVLSALNDSMLTRTSGMTSGLNSNSSIDTNNSQEIQQHVTIDANFPGVSSRTEIEEAFKNLVNIASQHAFNTQR